MKTTALFLATMMPAIAFAAPTGEQAVKDEEPLKVQGELRPPTQKVTQGALEKKVRDNLFKKEENTEKEQAKKE